MRLPERRPLPDLRTIRLLVAFLYGAALLAGCGSLPQFGKGEKETGHAAGAAEASEAPQAELPYFVAEDGLDVHLEPSAKSQVVGELRVHERVLRSEVKQGYARIRTEDDRVRGWIDNAKLIWRLPQNAPLTVPTEVEPVAPETASEPPEDTSEAPPTSPEAPAAMPEAPAATPEAPAAAPEAPTEEVPPEAAKPEPSVFNPF